MDFASLKELAVLTAGAMVTVIIVGVMFLN